MCFRVVSAVWVPKITLKHEKSRCSQGSGGDLYAFPRGFRFLGTQNHPKTRENTVFWAIQSNRSGWRPSRGGPPPLNA